MGFWGYVGGVNGAEPRQRLSTLSGGATVPLGDVSKAVGAAWKALDHASRAPFDELAIKDKERYARELAEFKARTTTATTTN